MTDGEERLLSLSVRLADWLKTLVEVKAFRPLRVAFIALFVYAPSRHFDVLRWRSRDRWLPSPR